MVIVISLHFGFRIMMLHFYLYFGNCIGTFSLKVVWGFTGMFLCIFLETSWCYHVVIFVDKSSLFSVIINIGNSS